MKKFTNILEQRIYLLYFLLTLVLVLIIISVEWQLVRFGVRSTENQKIYNFFNTYQSKINDIYKKESDKLSLIEKYIQKNGGISKENIASIFNLFLPEEKNNFVILDSTDTAIYGEKWELIKQYLLLIKGDKNNIDYILLNYGNRNFMIVYKKVMDKNSVYIGLLMDIKILRNVIPYTSNMESMILPYPFKKLMLPKVAKPYYNKIQAICKKNKFKKNSFIIRPSYSLIIGIYLNNTYRNRPTSLLLVFSKREINILAQRSIWFFILILIAVTLLMTAIFGNWFRMAVIHPVKLLSETMKKNSQDPTNLNKIKLKFGGVLGDMTVSFNQMEESLEKYSNYLLEYKTATENIENGVFWLSEDFKIIMYNNSFLRIFEENNEIVGKSFLDFVKLSNKDIQQIKNGFLSLKNYEYKKDSFIKHLNINFKLVKEKGKIVIVGGVTDITEITLEKEAREKLELELIKTNKLAEIGRRVEGIVHNMNSPLNSIIGYAQLMKKDIGENEDLEKILKSGKLIAHYIKTLQQKIKNDNMSMYHPVDINKLIKAELELFKNNLFFKHKVKTVTKFGKKLPKLNAVYGDVSMCITNIINNALEAMENSREKTLKISTELTDSGDILIVIEDTGCGIAEKDIPNIFEPYFSTKSYPKGSGYGLGLAISKYIVDKYKGKIDVKSKIDEGSVFSIIFPINEVDKR